MATTALAQEKVWVQKALYEKAECLHYERLAKVVAEKISEERELEASAFRKRSVSFRESESPPEDAKLSQNEQSSNSSKKSKDKNNKAAKRHRNLKKSKSDAVDPKEQITANQESQGSISPIVPASGSLVNEIAKARQHLKKSLQCMNGIASCPEVSIQDLVARFEKDHQELRNSVEELRQMIKNLELQVQMSCPPIAICPAKPPSPVCPVKSKQSEPAKSADADDDVDLFGSDSEGEDAEAAKIREERLAAYAAKKSKKPALIAKSNIILDIKPWDDETDMKDMEAQVRKIECDGLLWGAAKLVPLAFGIHKLQISCVVEDEKVSVDWLTDTIQDEIQELVQSVDIAAFNKI